MIDFKYQKQRSGASELYHKIRSVRSPVLNNDQVHFTAEGFNHIIYKSDRTERNRNVQMMRFKLLSRAAELIGISTTYQEYDEAIKTVRKKKRKKIVNEPATVKYWGLVAIIKTIRVKVIIRQIGNGQKHFWSLIPAWKKCHYKESSFISNAFGDLEND
jgi:hypothetical protein